MNIYDCHGVYIDQIGAAPPDLCYDPTHNHGRGGGSFWVDGYATMLSSAKAATGSWRILVTEDNAESYMDNLDGMLSLTAYFPTVVGSPRLIGAFPAVYGGYYTSFGQEFYQSDIEEDPAVFTAKVATMFVLGSQIGWFSLSGTNDTPPMAYYNIFMDPQYNAEVAYVNLVCQYRQLASNYLTLGRYMPELSLEYSPELPMITSKRVKMPPPTGYNRGSDPMQGDTMAWPPMSGAAWRNDRLGSLAIFITNNSFQSGIVQFSINLLRYGFPISNLIPTFKVYQIMEDGSSQLVKEVTNSYTLTYSTKLASLDVLYLLVT